MSHPDNISTAINGISNHLPFDFAMLINTTLEPDEKMPTAATDCYKKIFYNPEFMEQFDSDQCMFIICHEVWHIILDHMDRFKTHTRHHEVRYPTLMNVAADYQINNYLASVGHKVVETGKTMVEKTDKKAKGYITVREYVDTLKKGLAEIKAGTPADKTTASGAVGLLYDPSLDPEESMESVYDMLVSLLKDSGVEDQLPKVGVGGLDGGSDMDEDLLDETLKEEGITADEANTQRKINVASAAEQAESRSPGSVPGHIKGTLDGLFTPHVPWQNKLRRFFRATSSDDYSYRRPNRRSVMPIIRPSLYSESPGQIAIIVDESGSVSNKELQQGASEIQAILSRVKPSEVVVIKCDTEVADVKHYKKGERLKLERGAAGGTDMEPAFKYVDKHLRPDAVICFTDGEMYWPPKRKYPTMFAICNPHWTDEQAKEQVAWGEFVRVEVQK